MLFNSSFPIKFGYVAPSLINNAKISDVGAGGIADSDKTGWLSKIIRAFSPL